MSNRNSPRTRKGLASLLAMFVIALYSNGASATTGYTAFYAFGDSLSDTGNVFASTGLIPTAPYFNGRFSNGPVWIETVAAGIGQPIAPSLVGGTNYAFGGSVTGGPLVSDCSMLECQLPSYLGANGFGADPLALYSVYGGGNDVRGGAPQFAAANVAEIVDQLYLAGATQFLVPNLPNIGITPEAVAGGNSVPAQLASECVNFGGSACSLLGLPALPGLDDYFGPGSAWLAARPGINVKLIDVYTFVNNILADPGFYGFTNVTDPCYTGTTGLGGPAPTCANPDEYLFWDGIHPTAAAHELLGQYALSHIPVPAAVWLLASALGVLGFARRKVA